MPAPGTAPANAGTRPLLAGAVAGLVALVVFLGAAELVAAAVGPESAPTIAVGQVAIAHTPNGIKEFAIRHFGEHDKMALLTGISVVLALVAAGVGAAAGFTRRRVVAVLAAGVLGAVSAASAASLPTGGPLDAVPSLVGAACAAGSFAALLRPDRRATPRAPRAHAEGLDAPLPSTALAARHAPELSRRRLLLAGGGLAAAGAAALLVGRSALRSATDAVASRARVHLPRPARQGPLLAGSDLHVPGVPPYITPNHDFYRVDTALVVPKLPTEGYRLRLHGMVRSPRSWSYDELLRMPLAEHTVTLVCVSDPVGGPYVGNARWLGVPLAPLLREAGVHPDADQLLMTAQDGMTIGADLRATMDGRPALLAVGMNGQPLPFEHGFPVRAVIPGFYGYASACKWLVDLEVTTYEAKKAYWVERGYSERAPIKLESRIDTPVSFAQLPRGPVTVAGEAWLPGIGIAAVQVSVDNGAWHDAHLAAADSVDTWRQWRWTWHAAPGSHTLRVRAVDARGRVQTAAGAGVIPNGASGRQSVVVTVN